MESENVPPTLPEFTFGGAAFETVTPKRGSGWPLPKMLATPGRILHKRSKTFHEAPLVSTWLGLQSYIISRGMIH